MQTVSAGKGKGLDVRAHLLTFGSYRLGVQVLQLLPLSSPKSPLFSFLSLTLPRSLLI